MRATISIHALLAESDINGNGRRDRQRYFYPRSPCGERPILDFPVQSHIIFLSTLSLRRATTVISSLPRLSQTFLSTLSLRRATDKDQVVKCLAHDFYPRSPCGERPPRLSRVVPTPIFLSTLSLRRATIRAYQRYFAPDISIHALLAESDITV